MCRAPPVLSPATLVVSVSMNAVEFVGSATSPYSFYLNANITAVRPLCGPTAGNTTVSLFGSFPPGISNTTVMCLFDSVTVSGVLLLSASSSWVTCASPPGAGLVSLRVTLNGQSGDSADAGRFSFFKLLSLAPSRGPTTGGTTVTATGDGFVGGSPLLTFYFLIYIK
jgi:hypothetical protein